MLAGLLTATPLNLGNERAAPQLDDLLAAYIAQATTSCLQPCRGHGYAVELHSQKKNQDPNGNFLESWNGSCTSVLLWKRCYVLKLGHIARRESALCFPKVREHLSECARVISKSQGLESQMPYSSNCMGDVSLTSLETVSWCLLVKSWYHCPASVWKQRFA